jgi:cytochrome b
MKSYIWTLPTRVFHWSLAIGFTTAYILGDFDKFENLHFAFGAFVGTLILFRIVFGIFGPRYSNFNDFPIGPEHQKGFIKNYFSRSKNHVGHNPAAAVVILLILLIGLICSISGYLLYATENNTLGFAIQEDLLEEVHEVLANIFLGLVGAHLLGILADTLFHRKTGTLQSIFTGYKNIEARNVKLNAFHKYFVLLWIIVPIYLFFLAYNLPINDNETNKQNSEHYEDYND